MEFQQALPRLIATYRRGDLVPFIGSGMSCPSCNLWPAFIDSLNQQAFPGTLIKEGTALTRQVDRAVKRLSRKSEDGLESACRRALIDGVKSPNRPPAPTEKLASIPWSLVLTTNYDDWFPTCANEQARDGECYKWRVLGRSIPDCHELMSSLSVPNEPILWALQGFLGGQGKLGNELNVSDRDALKRQIVVGHDHYQRVMHTELHFRRAFSEVFRRRALWFLGSGLREDYFVNLFGEVLTTYGPNTQPHFFMVKADHSLDEEFLASRLNTLVITYKEHDELPGLIEDFEKQVSLPRIYKGLGAKCEHMFALTRNSYLVIKYGTVKAPEEEAEWSAAGCGRDGDEISEGVYTEALVPLDKRGKKEEWKLLQPKKGKTAYGPSIFRFGTRNCYAIAARDKFDNRDLRVISRAVHDFLQLASARKIRQVQMSLLVGDARDIWHPMFSLVQMVRGIRKVLTEGIRCPSITILTRNRDILRNLESGHLDISELLGCEDIRFFAEVLSKGNQRELLGVTAKESATISQVASLLGLDSASELKWKVNIAPRRSESHTDVLLGKIEKKTLAECGITFGTRVRFY